MNNNTKQIKFVVNAVKWFDKINGNTYHSVRITRTDDGQTITGKYPYYYGYGDHYRQTALGIMLNNGWLPEQYNLTTMYLYERENDYPICWNVSEGKKRDMVENGKVTP